MRPSHGRSFSAPILFTLSGSRCGPVSRSRTRRSERVDAENPRPQAHPARRRLLLAAAADLGNHCNHPERRRPGPVPASRRHRAGQQGPADGGAEEGGRLRGPAHLQPPGQRALLLHPPPGHRRVDHQHLPGPGKRKEALRGLGVHLRVPGPGPAARPGPGAGFPAGAGGAPPGRRRAPRLPRIDSRPPAQGVVGQGAGRPETGPLGAGRRRLAGAGRPRDPVRRGAGNHRSGNRRLRRGGPGADGRHPHRHPAQPDLRTSSSSGKPGRRCGPSPPGHWW